MFSCKAKKEVVSQQVQKVEPEQVAMKCIDVGNDVMWTETRDRAAEQKNLNTEIYKLFSVDKNQLRLAMIKGFQKNNGFGVQLPLCINGQLQCQEFILENSGAIGTAKQKEMGHFSFRGIDPSNPSNTVRADYFMQGGLQVAAQIDGEEYFLQPVFFNGSYVYITFAKKNFAELAAFYNLEK